jgi:hypothetical protein
VFSSESGTLLIGDVGKRLQEKAWDEILDVLKEQIQIHQLSVGLKL